MESHSFAIDEPQVIGAGTDAIAGLGSAETLGLALAAAKNQLTQFAQAPSALQRLDEVFGGTDLQQVANTLLEDWANGIFAEMPEFVVLDQSTLGGAQGAYAAASNTVYLADSLMQSDSLTGVVAVVLEEMGHHFDTQLNPKGDTAGDEGELFAATVLGTELTTADQLRLQTENDWGEIVINGEVVAIEQNESPDFNGDGNPDILWRNPTFGNNRVVFLGDTNNTEFVGAADLISVGGSWEIKGLADFNGDNNPDILWRDPSTGQNAVWFMGGTNNTVQEGYAFLLNVGGSWDIGGVADFNGDNNPDILWRDPSTGQNAIWFMGGTNNTVRQSFAFLIEVGGGWEIKGVADFNGDDNPDILWRDPTSGQNAVWFMGGTNNTVQEDFAFLLSVGGSWDIEGIADFNGDNNPDILWRDSSNGQNAIWYMGGTNNTVRQSFAFLDSVDTGWEIGGVAGGGSVPADLRLQGGSAAVIDATTVSLNTSLENIGTGNAGASEVRYWLSADATLNESDDQLLAPFTSVTSLNAGNSLQVSESFDYSNWNEGTNYIIAKADADNDLTETNEDNNQLAFRVTIPPAAPDLQIASKSLPSQVVEGDSLNASVTVANRGRTMAGTSTLTFYRSTDSVFGNGDDVELGPITVNGLGFNESQTVSLSFPTGGAWDVGSYFIFFEADSGEVIDEADEANNVGSSAIEVLSTDSQLPDLVVSLAGILNNTTSEEWSSDEEETIIITQGDFVTLKANLTNQGNAATPSGGRITYWLSSDENIGSDTQLDVDDFEQLLINGTESEESIQLDTSSWSVGTQYILFQADTFNGGQITESDEDNNLLPLEIQVRSAVS